MFHPRLDPELAAGLAAATALLARDRGGPPLAFQLLLSPMLDDRNTTPSSHEFTRRAPPRAPGRPAALLHPRSLSRR